ncbi:F0F1 ATP synthase subunit epsilon [Mucilaginibacter sp. X4EP1]|uniref:F0F1 ATP synthase subunit epsilon n=1 Tax=Mucilaginibacter sp. X4EP1 TaxID=2723092 RepID=UPI002168C357|nr:F0F1 ATP synthase subunit epsilon [Mucilaginibacter sp. X4EP1]MCS3812135.1 F-type H+-transporting ATPase subunit epsilon [Mucilaginibacter sp. X4EP1]
MESVLMDLKILLPFKIFAEVKNVRSVTADTNAGSYGFLPQRLDCVAILVPGIFSYETDSVHYLAVDEGILIKTGSQVLISVRNAIGGADLGKLGDAVKNEFLKIGESEKNVSYLASKLESGLMNRLKKFHQ